MRGNNDGITDVQRLMRQQDKTKGVGGNLQAKREW